MSENTYKFINLIIQASALLYFIFRLGRYMGESTKMFEMIKDEITGIKATHVSHCVEDDIRHDETVRGITDLRVMVAPLIQNRQNQQNENRRRQ